MKKESQLILWIILLILGLLGFVLQVFVFEAPDEILGFIICLMNVYFILGSIVKLCKLNKIFINALLDK